MRKICTAMLLAWLAFAFHAPVVWAEDESNPDYDEPPEEPECRGLTWCQCQALLSSAHPVVISSGNKIRRETDFRSTHEMPLELSRNFSAKAPVKNGLFGQRWFSNLDQSLRFTYAGGGGCDAVPGATAACILPTYANSVIASVTRIDGEGAQQVFDYHPASGTWRSSAVDADITVLRNADKTWTVQYQSGAVERYNVEGFVTEVRSAEGIGHVFTYSGRYLQRVTHSGGQYIDLGWSGLRVTSATDPAGNVYTYGYTPDGYLNQVVLPGPPAVTRTYHYEGAPGLMTGVSVNGIRYTTNDYYLDGRAHHSGLAGGLETDTFAYGTNPDGTTWTTMTNVAGATSTHTYASGSKKLVRTDRANIAHCPNHASQIFYDANGFVDYTLDFNGNRTEYTYGATGLLEDFTTGINAAFPGKQRYTDYIWDTTRNRLTGVKVYGASTADPVSETVYEYYGPSDPAPNRLKSVSRFNRSSHGVPGQMRKTSYTYTVHPNGMIATQVEDGPRTDVSDTTAYQYDSAGNLLSVTNALGHVTAFSGHNGLGLSATVVTPDGLTRHYVYDAQGRVATESVVAGSETRGTHYAYHRLGGPEKITYPDNSELNLRYDGVGRLIRVDQGGDQAIEFVYDAAGNRIRQDYQTVCPGDACTPEMKYRRQWEYDQIGRKLADLGQNGQRTEYRYDNTGNLTRIDPIGLVSHATTLEYGPNDELTRQVDALGHATNYAYDGAGRPASVTDANGQTTQLRHDGLGNLVQTVSQDTGTTTRTFDAAGNLKTETDARGVTVTYNYDALNRLTQKLSSASGSTVYTYVYDICRTGALCHSKRNSLYDTYFAYDDWGRMGARIQNIASSTVSFVAAQWERDTLGRPTQMTYPSGLTAAYQYDSQGRITQVSATPSGGSPVVLASNFVYSHPFAGPAQFQYGSGQPSARDLDQDYRTAYEYDGLLYRSFGYDEVDNLKTVVIPFLNGAQTTYGYDATGRLVSALDTAGDSFGNLAWTYDQNGNRQSETRNGGTQAYAYTPPNWLYQKGAEVRPRTANGNTAYTGTASFTYDGFNRLATSQTASETTTYTYNGAGERIRKQNQHGLYTGFLYDDQGRLIYEKSGTDTKEYVWLDDRLLARIDNGTSIYYYHLDRLGTPQGMSNQTGAVVWRADYEPFGKANVKVSTVENNIRFPGQYYDKETGLHYGESASSRNHQILHSDGTNSTRRRAVQRLHLRRSRQSHESGCCAASVGK